VRVAESQENAAPFEPEWEGFVTPEFFKVTPLPAKVYANEELCLILFFRSEQHCEIGCADRTGEKPHQRDCAS
jgi:dCTP deaminase